MNHSLLRHFRESKEFRALMQEILDEHRPVPMAWSPQATQDENARLMEEIKFLSAMQQGFDKLFNILIGNRNG